MKYVFLFLSSLFWYVSSSSLPVTSLWGWNVNQTDYVYDSGPPRPRDNSATVYSSCGNREVQGPNVGYQCPHLLLYSQDMILASTYDNLNDDFVYAVAGSSVESECGKCFQVLPLEPEYVWNESLSQKHLLVQVVNSGFDVLPGHLDIMMAAGGPGYFTSCNKDCREHFCGGGPCHEGLYDGKFDVWNPSVSCYAGGLRLVNVTNTTEITERCKELSGNSTGYKDRVLLQSCVLSNSNLYHQNFVALNALRVQCPDGLVRLSGLKRQDDDHLPIAHKENQLPITCHGSREDKLFCITTMQDCCMPSCSWMNKGHPDNTWSRVDACKRDGTLWNYPHTVKNIV